MKDPAAALGALRAAHRLRRRRRMEGRPGRLLRLDGRELLSFASNDYLGLAGDPRLGEALAEGARRYGAGAGASQLVTGHHRAHAALEEALAAFTGRERALLFSSGYLANLGVIGALTGPGEQVLQDRLNHASLLDGARLAGARLRRYRHADPAALEALVARGRGEALVVTDGLFSMDGDLAPLPALARACRRHQALLLVDDAHGLGVLGPEGRGSLALHGLGQEEVPLLVGTLGKAFGTAGAFVAGPAELVEWILQRARTLIYSTAPPPALAHAALAGLRLAQTEPWRRERLHALVRRFREGARALGLPLSPSQTPIQPLVLGEDRLAVAAAEALEARGVHVTPIRPPTVPEGTARLRITLSAAHREEDVDRLLEALREALEGIAPGTVAGEAAR